MPSNIINGTAGRWVTDINIITVLEQPEAWSSLSEERRSAILALLPVIKDSRTGEPVEPDLHVHPLRHPIFGTTIANYLQQVRNEHRGGFHRKAWHDEARDAVIRHANGEFDATTQAARETYWGLHAAPPPATDNDDKGMTDQVMQ